MTTTVFDFFKVCSTAVSSNVLIKRESKKDKEFHFQNWVRDRISSSNYLFEEGGRNSYPDFRIVEETEGYEVKGLAYPGRWLNYDCNSQVPSGYHNGRTIYYVFGRYPKVPDGNSYPALDLVICHGNFLNADHEYIHKNKNIKSFGSYGDIMIRDRKMYVAPTPYGLLEGVAHQVTLIIPGNTQIPIEFKQVGAFERHEVDELVVSYSFDLRTNNLTSQKLPNPNAGRKHSFTALRLANCSDEKVSLRNRLSDIDTNEDEDE